MWHVRVFSPRSHAALICLGGQKATASELFGQCCAQPMEGAEGPTATAFARARGQGESVPGYREQGEAFANCADCQRRSKVSTEHGMKRCRQDGRIADFDRQLKPLPYFYRGVSHWLFPSRRGGVHVMKRSARGQWVPHLQAQMFLQHLAA